jgi:quinol-cytochrome oxidoreductase complex cytochrome b subunit
VANGNGRVGLKERLSQAGEQIRTSQFWSSIFRPGSPFRHGYTDSPRNRSYVIMNNVLYHLHPVKVKRHAVRLSYTLCLGGLSFFLFILLTITGIFLMFYYRPTSPQAYMDIQALSTDVAFGQLVRNMHRWGAHLMVLTVFLHMARVFYLLPWDQLALWAVTVGSNMGSYAPLVGDQVSFGLIGGVQITPDTLLRWYVLHVLFLPFIIVVFMAVHFWRVRKDGGISGPL